MKPVNVGEFLKSIDIPFHAVKVSETATLQEVTAALLEAREQRCAYVVDGEGRLCGVISVGQLARHLLHEEIAPSCGFAPSTDILHYLTAEHARDIMERDIVCCRLDETLDAAARKMLGKKIYKSLPVVDDAMHLVDTLSIVSILEFGLNNGKKS